MDVVSIFKALGDRSRLRIAAELLQSPWFVEELAGRLGLAASTVSFHLKKMEGAGLVTSVKEGYFSRYHINRKLLQQGIIALLESGMNTVVPEAGKQELYERRVLATYYSGGTLLKIPAAHGKRVIVLKKLLARFVPGKTYTENEVDAAIRRAYPDYCTVRRFFVDAGWMTRTNGQYTVTASTGSNTGRKKRGSQLATNKELKQQYRAAGPVPGIVKVENLVTGSVYVAAGLNPKAVINRMLFELRTGIRRLPPLADAWALHGEAALRFSVIDELKPKEGQTAAELRTDLDSLEQLWLEKLTVGGTQAVLLSAIAVR